MAGSEEAREKLEKILAQDEYQVYYEDNRSLLEILWDNVKTWVLDFLSDLFSSFEPSNAFGNVVVAGLLVIVLALVGIVIWLVVRSTKEKRTLQQIHPQEEVRTRSLTKEGHLHKADELRQHDDLTEAARHVFLALLLHFNEIGWVSTRSWKTNWDYVMELKQVNKAGSDAFYELAGIFDEVFYGEHPMTAKDYDAYRNKADQWLKEDETGLARDQ